LKTFRTLSPEWLHTGAGSLSQLPRVVSTLGANTFLCSLPTTLSAGEASTATLVAPLTTPNSSLNLKNTRLFVGSSAMDSVASTKTAKVGEPPSAISTSTGSVVGAVGLMHTDVAGSVWHRLRVRGKSASPVSVLTEMVAPEPTLIVT